MRSQASSEGRRTLTLLGCRARRRLRHDGRVATAVLGRADAHVQPALGLVVTADAGCLSNRFCSVLLCPCMGSIRFRSVSSPAAVLRGRRPRARWARSAAFPQLLRKHGFGGRSWLQFYELAYLARTRAKFVFLSATTARGVKCLCCLCNEGPAAPPTPAMTLSAERHRDTRAPGREGDAEAVGWRGSRRTRRGSRWSRRGE